MPKCNDKCHNWMLISDPDPYDSFCSDDCAVVCRGVKNPRKRSNSIHAADTHEFRSVDVGLRPYQVDKVEAPDWCPRLKERKAEDMENVETVIPLFFGSKDKLRKTVLRAFKKRYETMLRVSRKRIQNAAVDGVGIKEVISEKAYLTEDRLSRAMFALALSIEDVIPMKGNMQKKLNAWKRKYNPNASNEVAKLSVRLQALQELGE